MDLRGLTRMDLRGLTRMDLQQDEQEETHASSPSTVCVRDLEGSVR
jgi:hypothetical protein